MSYFHGNGTYQEPCPICGAPAGSVLAHDCQGTFKTDDQINQELAEAAAYHRKNAGVTMYAQPTSASTHEVAVGTGTQALPEHPGNYTYLGDHMPGQNAGAETPHGSSESPASTEGTQDGEGQKEASPSSAEAEFASGTTQFQKTSETQVASINPPAEKTIEGADDPEQQNEVEKERQKKRE